MMVLTARRLASELGAWRGAGPAYGALTDRIRLLTLDGRIPLRTRLPAERELAAELGISRTTVAAAYAGLREAGYLLSTRGSGSVVTIREAVTLSKTPTDARRPLWTSAKRHFLLHRKSARQPFEPLRHCRPTWATLATISLACRASAKPSPRGTPPGVCRLNPRTSWSRSGPSMPFR